MIATHASVVYLVSVYCAAGVSVFVYHTIAKVDKMWEVARRAPHPKTVFWLSMPIMLLMTVVGWPYFVYKPSRF